MRKDSSSTLALMQMRHTDCCIERYSWLWIFVRGLWCRCGACGILGSLLFIPSRIYISFLFIIPLVRFGFHLFSEVQICNTVPFNIPSMSANMLDWEVRDDVRLSEVDWDGLSWPPGWEITWGVPDVPDVGGMGDVGVVWDPIGGVGLEEAASLCSYLVLLRSILSIFHLKVLLFLLQ